jgi:probable rRNA maturation factor
MLYFNEQLVVAPAIRKALKTATQRCLKKIYIKKDVSITFCSKAFIKKLNRTYRDQDKPTDVLSFSLEDSKLLGDIIIALPVARENAQKYGNTLTAELQYLIIHGLCHLLGHDHATPKETLAMRDLENRLLQEVLKDNIIVKGRI